MMGSLEEGSTAIIFSNPQQQPPTLQYASATSVAAADARFSA